MSDTITQQSGKKSRRIKRIIDVILALTLAGGTVFAVKWLTGDKEDIERGKVSSEEELESGSSSAPDAGKIIYSSELYYNEDVSMGSLIVVNNTSEYKGTADGLVSVYDVLDKDGTDSYTVMNSDVKLREEAAKALNDMLKDFAKETGHKDIVVDGGYRSVEYQQELYDAAEDKSAAAKPGFSDYHAGYSIDFGISDGDGGVGDFDGKNDYSWFEDNSYKYGYTLRYPDGKKDSTGYDYRPWHFRYVGKAHAYYMVKNDLCLEEYVEKLKSFEYTQTHLIFKDDDNNEYEVYYFPTDTTTDSTMVAVPSGWPFEVSGNNSDGFIVSFNKNDSTAANAEGSENANPEGKSSEDESSKDESTNETAENRHEE